MVWSPYTKRNIDKLERVQRRATKFILKSDDPYDIRLKKLNLMSLEKRRSLTDVTFLYKVLNGNINIDVSKIIDFHSEADRFSLRSKDSLTLSVIVRENRAEPKDRGRPFTFIFSQYKSYPKRLTTMIFAEVGVRFSSRYHHIMILASQAV